MTVKAKRKLGAVMYKGYYSTAATTSTSSISPSSTTRKGRQTSPVGGVSLILSSLRMSIRNLAYLVAGNVPAALGDELLDALVDLGLGGNDLVLYVLSDIRIT